jgi:hypothetical protein
MHRRFMCVSQQTDPHKHAHMNSHQGPDDAT